ncbi:MAG: baseplate J/gp47 family protein [Myxococcales bacterium]|nr:baseplate J/gp47 family protein [Myxococcales bacterium]
MPIKPPNLDDRRYDDIVREARALIPQYCPEWTNLSDADPGMTLVQLFAWMTEMTIYRLNRVPDKTYVHFLNFIGEERRDARPAVVPLTFFHNNEAHDAVEIPPYARCSTKQIGGEDAIHYLTTDPLTVHGAVVKRIVAVHAGNEPAVREVPFDYAEELDQVAILGGGRGVQPFRIDRIEHGTEAYTPFQYLYVAHDDFRFMDYEILDELNVPGRIRLRTATEENLPIAGLFRWERRVQQGWVSIPTGEEEEEVLGVPEVSLQAHMHRSQPVDWFGHDDDPFPIPEVLAGENRWIRGVVDYERWLAERMQADLEITWRDDRGGEERVITNWDVKNTGRYLEFFVQDMPPIRPGWTVRLTMVDRSMPTGRNAYFPRYRWSFRKGDGWETVGPERVRYQGTSIILTGPFTDMATDGYNLRAERLEAVSLRSLVPDLEIEATWIRPVVLWLAAGPESNAAEYIELHSLPRQPFQPATTLPPLVGMKFFFGSDVFENRAQRPVMLEIEVAFEIDGEAVAEPKDAYHLQLTYRAADTWRVVHTEDGKYAKFTFADLDAEGALEPGRRKIRIFIDPKEQLKGLYRSTISGQETCWLRFELTRSQLTRVLEPKAPPTPIHLKIYSMRLGVDGVIGKNVYEQPMPGLKTATVEHRPLNRRLSRALVRSAGRLSEHHPFDTFIDIRDDLEGDAPEDEEHHHNALYIQLSKPLPMAQRHAFTFKCRGETWLPSAVTAQWEQLEQLGPGRLSWKRLTGADEDERVYRLDRSGVLAFEYPDPVQTPPEGTWIRALFRSPQGTDLPALPPLSHVMLNTVDGVNLHEFRMEKFSGQGIPHQVIKLRRAPMFLHNEEEGDHGLANPDQFPDIRVFVTEDDGERREWRRAPGNALLTASKDDRVFVVDAVEGQLTFGNGIRGRMLPVGTYNVMVEVYHVVPGDAGNVGARRVVVCESFGDMVSVDNFLPATGGRNAESIDEILRRAPSVLTSRDRAVTRKDFEIIAGEASTEVARAACDGRMTGDGEIEIVVLPKRRESEVIPDPFLSTGLKEHVQRHLAKRCLVNVQPMVRLATFQPVDVSVTIRLRPNANFVQVREYAKAWIRNFLDPYSGGLDNDGWPFSGTLFAQDFGRMVTDISEVRHIVEVQVFPVEATTPTIDPHTVATVVPWDPRDNVPGWEKGQGVHTLLLDTKDLFILRHVRVISDEGEA